MQDVLLFLSFKFLEEDFLGFLEEWESEGMTVPGLSKTERGKLCLSLPTLRGLRMTGLWI